MIKHNYTNLLKIKIINFFFFCIKGCISEKQNSSKIGIFLKKFIQAYDIKKMKKEIEKKNHNIIKLILISMFKQKIMIIFF